MNPYVAQLKKYLSENPPNYEYEDIHSLLELVGSYYIMCNPIDNDAIRNMFRSLEPIMKSLSRKRENKLFHTMLDICEEYERISFLEGVRVGAQLVMELSE